MDFESLSVPNAETVFGGTASPLQGGSVVGEVAFRRWVELKTRNEHLIAMTKGLMKQCEELKGRLHDQELSYDSRAGRHSKPKRHRRTADQIERVHRCPTCEKAYGSEGSLLQHIKLKHENCEQKDEQSLSR